MSGEESTGNTPKTNVETSVADDKRSIMLKLEWGERTDGRSSRHDRS